MSHQPRFTHNPFSGLPLARGAIQYAKEWREDWPHTAWTHNPWTGAPRDSRDVESDPLGRAIWMRYWGPMPAARAADGVIDKATQYNAGSIECIDAIQAALTPEEYRGFLKGNVLKYTWRERHKGGEESLKKAQWYLARLLALGLALGGLSGCGSDYASPFDKPSETVLPVSCSASTPCQQ